MARLRHVLAMPFPAQGHVTPLLKLAHLIAEHGVKVTFINSIVIQDKLMSARPELFEDQSQLRFVALPDGMDSDEDRKDANTWVERYAAAVSPRLQELIKKINDPDGDDEKIDCVIGDVTAGWALEVAVSLGIAAVGFWPAGASCLLLQLHIPKLIKEGVIDEDGIPLRNTTIKISDKIPAWSSDGLTWSNIGDPTQQRALFGFVKSIIEYAKHTNIFLCNSFIELEPSAIEIIPGILPVGIPAPPPSLTEEEEEKKTR
ncbi:hypothetical protein MLD38_012511 [Melastoma candidum]|uniref:Uncharacterized protein n=1 Tax=Melastoma candidum TaxID=119954 RepID=A0ACB9R7M9_9MYRT|nr:hypothetical protein MLD38_012511 [Melastoma candidum]